MLRLLRCRKCQAPKGVRWSSTTSEPAPPLLAKVRNDLKNAMRAKDTARLNVLRAIISEAGNASKGPSPIKTDMQMLSLLRKRSAACREASQQFAEAKREDLKQKQDAEAAVLDEYASQVETVSEKEVRAIVADVIQQVLKDNQKPSAGLVTKELFQKGGSLDGKPVERAKVAALVQTMVQEAME